MSDLAVTGSKCTTKQCTFHCKYIFVVEFMDIKLVMVKSITLIVTTVGRLRATNS